MTNEAVVATSDQYDPNENNNKDRVTVTPQYADLAVTKTVDDATPNVGDTITYTVTLTNNGPDTASGVELTDTFPTAELQPLSATVSQGTYAPGSGVWTVGSLASGSSATLTITALVLAPATRPSR